MLLLYILYPCIFTYHITFQGFFFRLILPKVIILFALFEFLSHAFTIKFTKWLTGSKYILLFVIYLYYSEKHNSLFVFCTFCSQSMFTLLCYMYMPCMNIYKIMQLLVSIISVVMLTNWSHFLTVPCVDEDSHCARFNICAIDFQSAKTLCRKFCNLCDVGKFFQ